MLVRCRSLVAVAVLAAAVSLPAHAQRGAGAMRRLPYGYFRYRIPSPRLEFAPGIGMREDLRLRTMERSRAAIDRARQFELQSQLRTRQFDLQSRLRDRQFDLQDRAWRRQLENQDRAMLRMHERLDRQSLKRPLLLRRRSRWI